MLAPVLALLQSISIVGYLDNLLLAAQLVQVLADNVVQAI